MTLDHLKLPFEPEPHPEAVVRGPAVRFTVLTSRLIRLEYSEDEIFEDRPSQAFWYRRQPVPNFEVRKQAERIEIETEHLHLRYQATERGFTPATLSIQLKTSGVTWSYGDIIWRSQNLWGTTRTLDMVDGMTRLEPGLMARRGWSVVDDSPSLVFDEDGWLAVRAAPTNLDLYFFGYGTDYVACLLDFQKVAGKTPLIPRWALGNWWSRYWAYSQDKLQALMQDFQDHDMPLSVCIVDMDWHIVQTGNQSVGWTGYTWNEDLFPDPPGFMAWLHAKGLKTALNLHPADGVHPHEAEYSPMAEIMGIDSETQEPVPFDITNPVFTEAYFELLHHPKEAEGVDFWWMDWQQGTRSKLQGLDPLPWLNHLHFYDLGRDGSQRPFIFSRWGGLGNHRYPIGFSGDTMVSWDSLAFQPFFTATAANVAYGWWSHDIGGHMWGIEEGELYLRWVQFGVFSPILRLHSTKNPYSERRPWGWGPEVEQHARQALQLRHALIPYIYSMAWRNTDRGLPLITPLYYSHPDRDDAYHNHAAYWYGSELVAAPFTSPVVSELGLSRQRIWLPEGEWYNFFTGERVGGGWQTVYGGLGDIPLFAKAGAIVPLGPQAGWGGVENPSALTVHAFAGADNRFTLYEDDGETTAYLQGRYALTAFEQRWVVQRLSFAIAPLSGDALVTAPIRDYQLVVYGIIEPDQIEVSLNGEAVGWQSSGYDPHREALTVAVAGVKPTDTLLLIVSTDQETLLSLRDRRAERFEAMLQSLRLDNRIKPQIGQDLEKLLAGEHSLDRYELSEAQRSALEQVLGRQAG